MSNISWAHGIDHGMTKCFMSSCTIPSLAVIWVKFYALRKGQLGFGKCRERGGFHVSSSLYFSNRFFLNERYTQALPKEPSTNLFWYLNNEKKSSERNLCWKDDMGVENQKKRWLSFFEFVKMASDQLIGYLGNKEKVFAIRFNHSEKASEKSGPIFIRLSQRAVHLHASMGNSAGAFLHTYGISSTLRNMSRTQLKLVAFLKFVKMCWEICENPLEQYYSKAMSGHEWAAQVSSLPMKCWVARPEDWTCLNEWRHCDWITWQPREARRIFEWVVPSYTYAGCCSIRQTLSRTDFQKRAFAAKFVSAQKSSCDVFLAHRNSESIESSGFQRRHMPNCSKTMDSIFCGHTILAVATTMLFATGYRITIEISQLWNYFLEPRFCAFRVLCGSRSSFEEVMLEGHNARRLAAGIPQLTWSSTLGQLFCHFQTPNNPFFWLRHSGLSKLAQTSLSLVQSQPSANLQGED